MVEEDGDHLWRRFTEDIKPLRRKKGRKPATAPKAEKKPDAGAKSASSTPAAKPARRASPAPASPPAPATMDIMTAATTAIAPSRSHGSHTPVAPGAADAPASPAKTARRAAPPKKTAERVVLAAGLKEVPKPPPAQEAQIDRRTDDKLRKGKMPVEATLDLHGMTQEAAHDSLHRFITAAHKNGARCVLVITGKGISRRRAEDWMDAKPGILKQRLPQWLADAPLNKLVLRHYTAQPAHGGSGAFYIYLKRRR